MSSAYDPRSSRPRPASTPDPEAAPIDALLGPEPEPEASSAGEGGEPPSATTTASPAPKRPPSNAGAPSRVVQLLPLLVLGSLVALLVWVLTRRRSEG